MKNSVFTSLRTEGLATITELNNVELMNEYCKAVMSSESALQQFNLGYDAALHVMSSEQVGESLKAIKDLYNKILDKVLDLMEHMIDESRIRMSYDMTQGYSEHPLQDGLDKVLDNLEEVADLLGQAQASA
jgi:pyruvate/oxaloacetate carboxyltransferase